MNTYQYFAEVLTDREDIGQSAKGNRLISIYHYGGQNGDLMRDREMVFEIHTYASPDMAELCPSGMIHGPHAGVVPLWR